MGRKERKEEEGGIKGNSIFKSLINEKKKREKWNYEK